MTSTLKAIALATTLGLTAATSVSAQTDGATINMGHSMLVGALVNSLARLGVDSSGINNLTLTEVVQLRAVLTDQETSEGDKKSGAETILEKANAE